MGETKMAETYRKEEKKGREKKKQSSDMKIVVD